MYRICWAVALSGCLLAGCASHKESGLPTEISGVWTEGRPNTMVYLNIAGRDKTFATASSPGVVYSASVSNVDPDNRTVTVDVGVPENNGKEAENKQYVFREVGDGKGQPQHLIMTGPTGYQASLSFVRKLTPGEIAEQPTRYATGTTSRQPAAAGPAPATQQNNTSPSNTRQAPAKPTAPARQQAPKVASAPLQRPTPQPATPPQQTPAPTPTEAQGTAPGAENSAAATPEDQTQPASKQGEPPSEKAPASPQAVIAQARTVGCAQDSANTRYDCVSQKYHALDSQLEQAYAQKLAAASTDERAALAHDKYRWDIHRKETCRNKSYAVPGGPDRKTAVLLCWTDWTRQRLATFGKGAAGSQ